MNKGRVLPLVTLLVAALCLMLSKINVGVIGEEILTIKTFYPSDDAYVSSLNPDDNYGSIEYIGIKVDTMLPRDLWYSYIKFDLESIPPGSVVSSATMQLYVYRFPPPPDRRIMECWLVSKNWEEETITWSNQPPSAELVTSTPVPNSEGWISVDVKSSVEKFTSKDAAGYIPNYGWMLKDQDETSPTQYAMYSKEAIFIPPTDLKPRLEVNYYPPHLELGIPSSPMQAGEWVKMTVYRKTQNGEPITRGNLKVKLSSTSPVGEFALTPGGTGITELTIPDGSNHKDFYYYDENVGTWTISVWTDQYSPYGGDEESISVNPGSLDHFEFDLISSPQIVATPFTITITAYDAFGNVKTDYTGTNSLSDTTGTIEPKMTGAFVNGKWTGDVVINKVAKNVKITTKGAGKTGESNAFDVKAGPPVELTIEPSEFEMNAGETYSYLNITLRDAKGFETTSTSTILVSLSTTSPEGEFRDYETGEKITKISIPAGSSSVKVDYYDNRGGTWTLRASAAGLTPGTATVTVIADTTPPETTIRVGSPKHVVGATIYVSSSTSFSLSATDDLSGVKETKYRIDGKEWKNYVEEFNLSGYSDGAHEIEYYSVDNAGNNEAKKILEVFLDDTPPSVGEASPTGSLVQKQKLVSFTVSVEDSGSGIKEVKLVINGVSQGLMTKSDDKYVKTISLDEGDYSWSIEAIDNLGNSNTEEYYLTLIVDEAPPTITGLSIPSAAAWGESVSISCMVSDDKSGVKSVTLYYSTNGGVSWSSISMNLIGNRYFAAIPPQQPFARGQCYIEASDNVGNISQTNMFEYTVSLPMWIYLLVALALIVVATVFLLKIRKRKKPEKPGPSPPQEAPESKPEEAPPSAWQYPEEIPYKPQEPVLPKLDYSTDIYKEIKEIKVFPEEEEKEAEEQPPEEAWEEAPPEEEETPSIFEEEPSRQAEEEDLEP
jgi:hypothetical protein